MIKHLPLALLTIIVLDSCEFKNEEDLRNSTCDTFNITYAKVKPILDANCVKCHNEDINYEAIKLNSYENVVKAAQTNHLVLAVNHISSPGIVFMPFNLPKLEDCEVRKITILVNTGVPK